MIDRVFDLWEVYDNKEKVICLVRNTDAKDLCDLLNELQEENEKLHHAIVETEKMVQSTYDELTKLRCIKKNLGRLKTQWDWIMEAIQYD